MPDLPPTPQPGEVWENDDGERRFVYGNGFPPDMIWWSNPKDSKNCCSHDTWLGWAIRTNARVVLQAKGEPKQC